MFSRSIIELNRQYKKIEFIPFFEDFEKKYPHIILQFELFNKEINNSKSFSISRSEIRKFYQMYKTYLKYMINLGEANNSLKRFDAVPYCQEIVKSLEFNEFKIFREDVLFFFKFNFLIISQSFNERFSRNNISIKQWNSFKTCIQLFIFYVSIEKSSKDVYINIIFSILHEIGIRVMEEYKSEHDFEFIQKNIQFYNDIVVNKKPNSFLNQKKVKLLFQRNIFLIENVKKIETLNLQSCFDKDEAKKADSIIKK